MDARGIYASDTKEQAAKFGDGLLTSLQKMDELLADWKTEVPDHQRASFENLLARAAEFKALPFGDGPARHRNRSGSRQ
jgi:methyl-accepting chemotaxis protein